MCGVSFVVITLQNTELIYQQGAHRVLAEWCNRCKSVDASVHAGHQFSPACFPYASFLWLIWFPPKSKTCWHYFRRGGVPLNQLQGNKSLLKNVRHERPNLQIMTSNADEFTGRLHSHAQPPTHRNLSSRDAPFSRLIPPPQREHSSVPASQTGVIWRRTQTGGLSACSARLHSPYFTGPCEASLCSLSALPKQLVPVSALGIVKKKKEQLAQRQPNIEVSMTLA